jgi:methyl-accepting chemotaxis protein
MTRGMATFDFEPYGTVPPANPIFLPVSGYRKEEGTGPHHQIFMDDRGGCASSYRECREMVRRGEAQAGEFRRNGKGGKEFWIYGTYLPIPDENGKGKRGFKIPRDVTERAEIRAERERLDGPEPENGRNRRGDIGAVDLAGCRDGAPDRRCR